MCMPMAGLLCCAAETSTVLGSNYTPIKIYLKKKRKESDVEKNGGNGKKGHLV